MKNTKDMDKVEIMLLAKLLPDLNDQQMDLVRKAFPETIAYRREGKRAERNGTYWCCRCGGSANAPELDMRINPEYNPKDNPWNRAPMHIATCPHCGATMVIHDWSERKQHFADVIGIHTSFGDWKVDRFYNLDCYCKPGQPEESVISPIGAQWSRGDKTYYYIAPRGGYMYSKFWKPDGALRFAESFPVPINWRGSDCEAHYDTPADFSIEPLLTKHGIDPYHMHGMRLTALISLMQKHPAIETLWKAGEYKMVKELKGDVELLWPQIKIIRRQGYQPANFTEWRDMVWLLRDLGLDDHSPKYLCPENLHAYHQYLLARRGRERDATQLRNALRQEPVFIEMRKPYFGLSIPSEKGFTIVCLRSIREFKHEGDVLQHCVFHGAYYSRPKSLILSARDGDNNPIETLEIDLEDFRIRQCYGFQDGYTPLHDDIKATMQANMWQVRDIAQRIAC